MDYLQDLYLTNFNAVYNFGGYFSIKKNENWVCGAHTFEQCKFYFITEGQCVINIKGKDYQVNAGDWFFIPAGVEHSYYNINDKPFKKYWMHFDLYPSVEIFKALGLPYFVRVEKDVKVMQLFKTFAKAIKSNELTDKLTVKACLINLLVEYIKIAKPDGISVQSRTEARLDDVLRYINENLEKDLSVEVLAEKYFAHPNHFIRAFKDKTGYTPAKYVKQKRIESSKRLLESTDLTTAEITEKLGFSDSAHFSRVFKEYYNMPPAKYRAYFEKSKK